MLTPAKNDFTYKKAHKLALTQEAAAKSSKDISTSTTQQIEPILNFTRSKLPDGTQTKSRLASQRKFRTIQCHQCHKTGHIASPHQKPILTTVERKLTTNWRKSQY